MNVTADAAIEVARVQRDFERCEKILRQVARYELRCSQMPRITTTTILLGFRRHFSTGIFRQRNPVPLHRPDSTPSASQKVGCGMFSNQVTCRVGTSTSIKVFENGKIHITGTRSLSEACEKTWELFTRVLPAKECEKLVLDHFAHQMINLKFRLHTALVLEEFVERVRRQGVYTVFYDPSRYPGVRIKMLCGTLLIFATGSVLVTGAKTPDDLVAMVRFLSRCLQEDRDGHDDDDDDAHNENRDDIKAKEEGYDAWSRNVRGFRVRLASSPPRRSPETIR